MDNYTVPVAKPVMTRRKKWLIGALVFVLVGCGGLVAYAYRDSIPFLHKSVVTVANNADSNSVDNTVDNTEVVANAPDVNATNTVDNTSTITPVTDTGVTWQAPAKLSDLGIIIEAKNSDNPSDSNSSDVYEVTAYYKIATLSDGGEIVLAVVQPNSLGGPSFLRFRKSGSKYYYLSKNSDTVSYGSTSGVTSYLSTGVLTDSTTKYNSIVAPDLLTLNNSTLKNASSSGLFSEIKTVSEMGTTNYGKVYEVKLNDADTEVGGLNYALKLADSTYVNYTIKYPFMADDSNASVTWSDGTKVTGKFTPEGFSKCGMVRADNSVLNLSNITGRLTAIGTVSNGDTVYGAGSSDAITSVIYENYKTGRDSNTLELSSFTAKKPYFVWKSGLSTYVVFTSTDYAGLAECGKPVVYLYPQKPTQVSVKVGANITKSDPEYGTGWSVLAQPNGSLTLNNKTYPYLFWEGKGQDYPRITSGFVVRSNKIEATLLDHLARLGLNSKESSDFMEFWLPKMPATPFVRLTWFGTGDMNKLAPLTVSPKPDTTIRIFLDFEGINQLINIPAQRLTSPVRNGFTLVEWGGLLRGENK